MKKVLFFLFFLSSLTYAQEKITANGRSVSFDGKFVYSSSSGWDVSYKDYYQVVNDTFEEIEASITWTDDNNVVVVFNTSTTGYVYCN
jgi:hypothetical protein